MKGVLVLLFIMFAVIGFAQIEPLPLQAVDSLQDSIEIVLQFDSLPEFSFFNPQDITQHRSRIAALQQDMSNKDYYFYLIIAFSLIISLVFLNSKEMVKSSLKSFSSLQNTIQFSRTEKQSNSFYFVLYLGIFILGISLMAQYVSTRVYGMHFGFTRIAIFVVLVFLIDYLSTYLFLLFSSHQKSLDMVQTVILTYPVLLAFILWPALFFVVLSGMATAKLALTISLAVLALIFLLKEIRTIQVLWIEKIEIFSFHFFAYLCTFKFLPIIVLAKIFF